MRKFQKPAAGAANYDCSPQSASSNETCTINLPAAGWWYVGINTFNDGLLTNDRVPYTVTATY